MDTWEPLVSEHAGELAQDPAWDPDPDRDDTEALLPDVLPDLEPEPEEKKSLTMCFEYDVMVMEMGFDCT